MISQGDADTPSTLLFAAGVAAAFVPLSIAYSVPPTATLFNQAAAWIAWGAAALVLFRRLECLAVTHAGSAMWSLWAMLLLIGAFTLPAPWHDTSWSLAWPAAATPIAAAVVAAVGACAAGRETRAGRGPAELTHGVFVGMLLASAVGAAIGALQVWAPTLADGQWIAAASGRAAGNLRQPNQLATLLVWGCVAAVWLIESGRARVLAVALTIIFIYSLALTLSRTGAVSLALLAIWGGLDRRLNLLTRVLLGASPLILIAFLALLWATEPSHAAASFEGVQRFRTTDNPTSSRFAIWANAVDLIRAFPWLGVGMNGFNRAWTLAEIPDRPREFFDHAHNLPLQLCVELGLPIGLALFAALLYAFRHAFVAAWQADEASAVNSRCAFMMLAVIGLHSLLEYPLWYAHFLFPAAFLWGYCLGSGRAGSTPHQGLLISAAGAALASAASLLMIVGAVVAIWDHSRVTTIFVTMDDQPLAQRIEKGRHSWFFGHHADYALVTTTDNPGAVIDAFKRPVHHLLDTRLMIAWSKALAATGDVDRARWVAARLAEFHHPDAQTFFAPCNSPPADGAARPFQCEPPQRRYTFKDFR